MEGKETGGLVDRMGVEWGTGGGVTRRDGHINHLSDCRGFT